MKQRTVLLSTLTLAAALATALAIAAGPTQKDQPREANMRQQTMAAQAKATQTIPAQTGPASLDLAQPKQYATATFAMG